MPVTCRRAHAASRVSGRAGKETVRSSWDASAAVLAAFLDARWFALTHGVESISDAVRSYGEHATAVRSAPSVAECVGEYLREREQAGYTRGTMAHFGRTFREFIRVFGTRTPASVRADELCSALRLRPSDPVSYRQAVAVSTFFAWSVRRRYAFDNPVPAELRRHPVRRPTVLTPFQVLALLRRTSKTDEIGYWVLCLFGGLRTAEIVQLSRAQRPWAQVKWRDNELNIPAGIGCVPRRLTMSPVLRAWLAWLHQRRAKFYPANAFEKTSKTWRWVCTHYPDRQRKGRPTPPSPRSGFNLGRDTHLVYRLAVRDASPREVAFDMGLGVRALRRFRDQSVLKQRTTAFFALTPDRLAVRAAGTV